MRDKKSRLVLKIMVYSDDYGNYVFQTTVPDDSQVGKYVKDPFGYEYEDINYKRKMTWIKPGGFRLKKGTHIFLLHKFIKK
jgi:hypothetical protein